MEAALASPRTAEVMVDVDLVAAVKPQRGVAMPLLGAASKRNTIALANRAMLAPAVMSRRSWRRST